MSLISFDATQFPSRERVESAPEQVQRLASLVGVVAKEDVLAAFQGNNAFMAKGSSLHLAFLLGIQYALMIASAPVPAPEPAPSKDVH